MQINVPEGYKSKDVIDRRDGRGPSLIEKAEDLYTTARKQYEEGAAKKQPVDKSYFDPVKAAPKVGKKSAKKQSVRTAPLANKRVGRKKA